MNLTINHSKIIKAFNIKIDNQQDVKWNSKLKEERVWKQDIIVHDKDIIVGPHSKVVANNS